ncbi:MAG: PAS domain-containing protein [Bacteroidetes bacterium]|nr:PAS domain-containing protein [Bacteroidota bacterium]
MIQNEIFLSLINNMALLLLLGFIYDLLYPWLEKRKSFYRSVIIGVILGSMGMIVMLMPWRFTEEIIFDTRSIVLCISGLFFGAIPTAVAVSMTIILRIIQGGMGILPGLLVIITSGGIGLMWRDSGKRFSWNYSFPALYILGVVVHIVMLLLMLSLPISIALPLLRVITLPVMIIYPLGTALLGRLLHGRQKQNLLSDQLQESHERLDITLQSIGDGVITTDVDGHIQLMNRVAEDLTGWKQQEAAGKPLEEVFIIIHEDTRKAHVNPVEKVMLTGEVIELENHTLLISRDGTERVIADSGAPIRNIDSEIIGVVLVIRDQTESRKLQNRMQRNEKLESLGVLAGGLAHDFNNLLNGLFGYIELAEDVSSEETVKLYLSNAMDVFDRAKGITLQLLTFARGGDPVRKGVRIDELVTKNAAFILTGTNIAVSCHVADDLWLCRVDENQIGQVIDNLVINARQAMPDGGVISVRMENVEAVGKNLPSLKPGRYVAISFEDTGVGIPIEIVGKVFDPFFTTKPSGSGLGLATCYSIIQRHGGIIEVSSTPGKGSCFTVYLPKADSNASLEPKSSEISHMGNGLVLVLDDEDHMRDIVRQIVEDMGYAVLTAGDGERALRLTKDAHEKGKEISAALLDLTIPGGLGGFEILEEIKNTFPECILFASSGYSNNPIMSEPAKFGFHDSLHKPYRKQELQALFSRYLS